MTGRRGPAGMGRTVAVVAAGLAAVLALGACSAGGGDDQGQAAQGVTSTNPPTTAAPSTAVPTTAEPAPTTAAPATTAPPTTAAPTTTTKPKPAAPAKLRSGSEGAQVKALQRRLHELGYQVQAADGQFGPETHHSVVAFQKVNRLGRDGVVGPITRKALERPRVPKPRSTKAGFHVEADLTLQVVYMVRD
ncbi:MAG TPA: peptidoglycan-binding domain-containing protein, partial [Actinomycetota bacterium]|nr:peptidoglycan-binding domain-containing protein [Actinomycetota bacterium]